MIRYVYVAGPYSKGDVAVNVRTAVLAADTLLQVGLTPFVPHLTHFWHLLTPHDYEEWLTYDAMWLRKCDAVLRLPGESGGADRETALAGELGIPVFTSMQALLTAAQGE